MSHPTVSSAVRPSVRLWRIVASLFVMLGLAGQSLRAADAATGNITGSVTSAGTKNALQGATVTIPSLNRTELTDSTGSFIFQGVPSGAQEIVINYSGFTEARERVVVPSGQTARLDSSLKTSDVLAMAAFTVETQREGQALALTEQRNASNIKNVTAMDEWGNLPTMSVGELAMRLPGITFTVDEDNLVNNVSIRGMPSSYTRLNVDGMSSTGVGGDGRSATLHSFSGAMYESLEVIAGQTPDKRADSLGGQLNLKTRSPLAMKEKRRFNYNVGARISPSFAERSQQRADHASHPIASLAYQEVFDAFGGHHNLGISVNLSHSEVVNMIVYDNLFYESTLNPVAYFNDYTTITGQNTRFITGIGLRADYRPSARTTISLRFLYNAGSEPFYERTRIDPLGNGTTSIAPGYTADRTTLVPVAGAAGTRMDLEMWRFSFVSKNPTGTVAVEHDLGRLKLDYAARWSNTHWDSGPGRQREGGQLFMRAENLGFTLDKSNLDGRVFTQNSGVSVYDPASYTTNISFTKRDTVTDTNEVSANVNASYLLSTKLPITLKAGLDTVNRRVNNRNVAPRQWTRNVNTTPAVGAPAGSLIPLSGYSLMPVTRFEEKNPGTGRIPVFDPVSVSRDLSNTSLWTENLVYASQQPFTNRRIMEEGVDAGYLQAQTKISRLTLLGGVRVEDVQVNTFNYIKLRSTTVAQEADPFKRALLDYAGHTTKGTYTKAFPSIHAAYDITSNLKARASWSTSYGRPTLAQLIPAITFSDTNQTVTAGNPALKPQVAKNIDLKLEYYSKSGGIFSIGAFQKDIDDYILNALLADKIGSGPDNGFEGNFVGYSLTAATNAGSAKVRGWEADYRQRLSFLPGFLKGLTFAANYTWLETTGKFTGITDIAKNDVVGFIPRAGNARLLYAYKRFGANVGLNFTGEHIHPLSGLTPTANRLYRKDLTTLNAGFSYKIRPDVVFSMDVANLTQKGPVTYRYIESRTRQVYLADLTINAAISGQF